MKDKRIMHAFFSRLFSRLASPKYFYDSSRYWIRWSVVIGSVAFIFGLVGALVLAPPDYRQGDAFRIIYIHVPSAFLSMAIYGGMTLCALLSLIWHVKLADIMLKVSAGLGAWFTVLALVTGSLWGKPMWGTWWIWDARLTSELILLFIYFGVIALQSAISDRRTASRAGALWVLVGAVDIPIIHYSVSWWNTLHQGPTLTRLGKPAMASSMLFPLLIMIVAFGCYFVSMMLLRARTELLQREYKSKWVRGFLELPVKEN